MLNKSSDFFYQKENFMIRTLKSHAPKESEKKLYTVKIQL